MPSWAAALAQVFNNMENETKADLSCVFCKIARKEIPANAIYEDAEFIVIPDRSPKAPVHILIIPKEHIVSIAHTSDGQAGTLGQLLLLARKIAENQGLNDYKLALNAGKYAEIKHLHLHLLGGDKIQGALV